MKIENAIKKLSKYGKVQRNEVECWIERGNYIIGFLFNGEKNTCCEYTREKSVSSLTGFTPTGSLNGGYNHYDNLTQAIDYVLRMEKKEQEEENIPCVSCGRLDLPLHFNHQCPECFTPPEKAGSCNEN